MSLRRTERVVAVTALLYPVLTVAGFVAFPQPPGGDVSAAHDPGWLALHADAVIAQSYVRALAAVAFIALSVAVARAATPAREGGSTNLITRNTVSTFGQHDCADTTTGSGTAGTANLWRRDVGSTHNSSPASICP